MTRPYCGTKSRLPVNSHFGDETECAHSKQLRLYGQRRATTYSSDETATVRRMIRAGGMYCGGEVTPRRGTAGHAQAEYCKQKGQLRAWGRFVYPLSARVNDPSPRRGAGPPTFPNNARNKIKIASSTTRSSSHNQKHAHASNSMLRYPNVTLFQNGCTNRVVYTHTNPEDVRNRLNTKYSSSLNDRAWLNDEVINAQSELLNRHAAKNIHVFNPLVSSFFLNGEGTLTEKAIKRFRSKDVWYMPYNYMQKHWILIVIDFEKQRVRFYDSMITQPSRARQITAIKCCMLLAKRIYVDMNNFDFEWCNDMPQQSNEFDCGVFVIYTMRHLLNGRCWAYQKLRSSTLRRRIAYEIHHGILLDPMAQSPLTAL